MKPRRQFNNTRKPAPVDTDRFRQLAARLNVEGKITCATLLEIAALALRRRAHGFDDSQYRQVLGLIWHGSSPLQKTAKFDKRQLIRVAESLQRQADHIFYNPGEFDRRGIAGGP